MAPIIIPEIQTLTAPELRLAIRVAESRMWFAHTGGDTAYRDAMWARLVLLERRLDYVESGRIVPARVLKAIGPVAARSRRATCAPLAVLVVTVAMIVMWVAA